MEFFEAFSQPAFLDFLAGSFVLFPAGILLGILAWLVSYLVHAAFKLLRL